MTNEMKQIAAEKLMRAVGLAGEGKRLPKIFIAGTHCFWFLNAARRQAYEDGGKVEMMTINEAFELTTNLPATCLKHDSVAWNIDQRGDTYDGRLFNGFDIIYPDDIESEVSETQLVNDKMDKAVKKSREMIVEALERNSTKKAAAAYLGISVQQLYKKLKQFNIPLK